MCCSSFAYVGISMNNNKLKAVDFFCSGGGMSYGMQVAGIEVLAGIDYDKSCRETYESNIKGAKFIHADVFELDTEKLEEQLSLEKRFVEHLTPGYVVVENVPGVLRRKEESGLEDFIEWLENNNYTVHHKVHEVSQYGVPQHRKRFTLIASRVTVEELEPVQVKEKKKTVRDVIGVNNGFPKISAGHKDNSEFKHTAAGLREINLKRLAKTEKDGGTRMSYVDDEELAPKCHKSNKSSFKDTYGRMWWDKPSPTITTKFFSISNGRFAHPEENRAISLREGATLQSFPKNYKFKTTSIANTARMIGNAVPPKYAEAIGKAIIKARRENG